MTIPNASEPGAHPETEIDPTRLGHEYTTLPGYVAFWATRHADAVYAAHQAKDALKGVRARVWQRAHDERWGVYTAGMTKQRPTEKLVESVTEQDPEVVEAQERLSVAQHERDRIGAVLQALEVKASMLISLGADRRTELKHLEVRVNE